MESPHTLVNPLAKEGDESPPAKRQRIARGKHPVEDMSEFISKVVISEDGKKATIDLTQEWFPASASEVGAAHSLGQTLVSPYLEKRFKNMPTGILRDQASRFYAASWKICDYLGEELDLERRTSAQYEGQAIALDKENLALIRKYDELADQKEAAKEEYAQSLQKLAETQEKSVKNAVDEVVSRLKKKHKQEMDVLQASNRRLREQNQVLEDGAVLEIRNGIALCLKCLRKNKAIVSEWDDAKRVEEWLSDNECSSEGSATNT